MARKRESDPIALFVAQQRTIYGPIGSVRWVEKRASFQCRVRLPDGTRPVHWDKDEFNGWKWIFEVYGNSLRGVEPLDEQTKVGDYIKRWLEHTAPKTIEPNSLYNYTLAMRFALPHIGRIKLKDLKRHHIDAMYTALDETPTRGGRTLSRSTQQQIHRVLKMALEAAVDDDLILKNPMRNMKPPRLEESTKHPLTIAECKRIFAAAEGTRWFPAIWVMATTGMRISEVLGMTWDCVDTTRGYLVVEKQTEREYGKSGVRFGPLKTRSSYRTIPIPPSTCRILDDWRAEQDDEKDNAEVWYDHNAVFCQSNGNLYFRSQMYEIFKAICKQENIEHATPHTLRMTISSLVQELGHPVKAASALLGHASERMTLTHYTRTNDEQLQRIAATVHQVFGDTRLLGVTEAEIVRDAPLDGEMIDAGN